MIQQIYPSPTHSFQYELNKDLQFAAAHFVPHSEAGVCQQVHGHTYFVNITIAADELDDSGFLVNFKDIKTLIHNRFDHRILNEDSLFSNDHANDFPTSEVLARKVYEIIQQYLDTRKNAPKCLQIFLRETPTSYVIYRPKEARGS